VESWWFQFSKVSSHQFAELTWRRTNFMWLFVLAWNGVGVGVVQRGAAWCSVLQCVAVFCSVLQCVAGCEEWLITCDYLYWLEIVLELWDPGGKNSQKVSFHYSADLTAGISTFMWLFKWGNFLEKLLSFIKFSNNRNFLETIPESQLSIICRSDVQEFRLWFDYGLAMVSRIHKIISLFCRILSLL